MEKYYSQIGQDKLVDELLNNKENGFFIDIGAHDGQSSSNSLFFEENRNWNGICIEPGINEYKSLCESRKSININACISNYDGNSNFTYINGYANMLSGLAEDYVDNHINRINNETNIHGGDINVLEMPVFKLQTILDKYNISEVDYCSIDTEGSEFKIIQSIDFDKVDIKVFSIENNYGDDTIKNYLESKGYNLHCKLQWDDIFIKNDFN